MEIPIADVQKMYTIIADTLPTEGRDYTIRTSMGADKKLLVDIKPITPLGQGFVPIVVETLNKGMNAQNVKFAQHAGVQTAQQEAETINTIRAGVERDQTVALQTHLREAKQRHEQLMAQIAEEDKARNGRKPTVDEATRRENDMKDAKKADMQRRQLEFMIAHMPEARSRIIEKAKAAAQADAKTGTDWAVDFNAPLTTLFDRKTAADTLKRTELAAQQLAAYMFMEDDISTNAAASAKKYALQK